MKTTIDQLIINSPYEEPREKRDGYIIWVARKSSYVSQGCVVYERT
jgi:hypothetical protein